MFVYIYIYNISSETPQNEILNKAIHIRLPNLKLNDFMDLY